MRLAIRRRLPPPEPGVHILEVVVPRTNAATLSSAEHLLAAVAVPQTFGLEIAADADSRRFLVRTSTEQMQRHLASQVSAAYPQAELRPIAAEHDPACVGTGEQLATRTLRLRAPNYLPIRTFTDLDLDAERSAQADPVLGILTALGDLPDGWRGLSQLVLQPAPDDWCRDYLRFSVQHPLEHERVPRPPGHAGPMLAFLGVLLVLATGALRAYMLMRAEQWPQLAALGFLALVAVGGAVVLVRRLLAPNVYDMDLVREKVSRPAYRADLRLAVFAPASADAQAVNAQLERLAAAYRRYNLAAANGFVSRSARYTANQVRAPAHVGSSRGLPMLTTRELAGLWHLPHAAADVPLVERTTARRWLPLPPSVAAGCRIGASDHQGRSVAVALPGDILRRHMLLVAKTRRGKSTLMLRLAHFAMQSEPRRSVLLVDPHHDLARAALEVVPGARAPDVVYLDVADGSRPFGLNLVDTGLGWDRDRAVANALSVFQREWGDRYWGPRMEDAFRFALLSLFEANAAICAQDPLNGRYRQYTLLEVPSILSDVAFRREVLHGVTDPSVKSWWADYFEPLDRRFQLELINPILTKIHRFEGNTGARNIVGQPASTIDPATWLREGSIVIVNTARGSVGENAAALIGSTLLNLMTLGIAAQAGLPPGLRRPISIFVDEFHTIPGADYEGILAELSKYGANLVLATQSLARLLASGRDDGKALRATVFANLDGLFAFNCSAEDAEYLVPELGGALEVQDLVELGEHRCYVRLSSGGQRLPTFSVQLDPPLDGDAERGAQLALLSAERYGRDVALVEADRRSAVARVLEARSRHQAAIANAAGSATPRNQHRPRKKRRSSPVTIGATAPEPEQPVEAPA